MQIDFQFLGSASVVPDAFTPRFGIRYNSQGFDAPINWKKREKKLLRKGVPQATIEILKAWDGSKIPTWIDGAWTEVRTLFMGCGAEIRTRAEKIRADRFTVRIESSVFKTSFSSSGYTTGMWSPSPRLIRVLCIYPGQDGWVHNAKDLLVWEVGNMFSLDCGIIPEDPNGPGGRPKGWPCAGPRK